MNTLFAILAQTTPSTAPATDRPWYVMFFDNPILLMALLLVVFYMFLARGKKNEEKQRQNMLSQLKRGDRIQTIGGILGTVVEVRDNEVVVKVDESSNAKVRFVRSAIHRVLEEEKSQPK